MQCPKCKKDVSSERECEYCGIIFEKYQERSKSAEILKAAPMKTAEPPESSRSSHGLIWVGLAVLIVVGLIAYFAFFPKSKPSTDKVDSQAQSATTTGSSSDSTSTGDSIRDKLLASFPPKNNIEKARNATVYVKTAWGVYGSGFFIDSACHVVTNRHVVNVDKDELKQATELRNALTESVEREKAALAQIRERPELSGNPNAQKTLREREKRLEAATAQLDAFNTMIEKAGMNAPSDVKVVLIDGTELSVQSIQMSESTDLALLDAWCTDSPFISQDNLKNLAQGQKLFTVGNPEGMKFTVTSGVFSGWQDVGGLQVLQTDAPINPGNSGGPLLTENGNVVGVNTAILRAARSIGFALPIDLVFQEFQKNLKK